MNWVCKISKCDRNLPVSVRQHLSVDLGVSTSQQFVNSLVYKHVPEDLLAVDKNIK